MHCRVLVAASAMRGRTFSLLTFLLLAILMATLNFDSNRRFSASPILEDSQAFEMRQRFEPVQVMEQYRQWHGVDALGKQGKTSSGKNRKFAVAYLFPCAARAGNQFHNFFNNLLWAIVANRTLLVRFDSPTRQLCMGQSSLNVAPWLPLWDDWAARLRLSEDDIDPVPIDTNRERSDRDHPVVMFPQIPDVLHEDEHIFRARWIDHPINNVFGPTYIENMGVATQRLTVALYGNGPDFLRGMLYRYCFLPMGPKLSSSSWNPSSPIHFSVALHSRHTVVGDTGEFVKEEISCLSDMLPENRSLKTCSVCLMSDRIVTIQLLSAWLLAHNCTPVVAENEQRDSLGEITRGGGIPEHGDRPGDGFLLDLDLCSRARNGTIGDSHRSSYMLLHELVDFERQVASDHSTTEQPLHCELKQREPSGYDYGPGTPLFRHWSKQKPFKPVAVFQRYKKLHGVDAIEGQLKNRQFAVAPFSLGSCSITANWTEYSYSFLNHFLWSILSNRTLLWVEQNNDGRFQTGAIQKDCRNALQLAPWIPSYVEWAAKLGLPSLSELNSIAPLQIDTQAIGELASNLSGYDSSTNLVVFESQPSKLTPRDLETIFSGQSVPESAKSLFHRGTKFFYGMMFAQTLVFADTVLNGIPRGSKSHPDVFSIAIDAWKNDNILNETACFMKILSVENLNTSSCCRAFLMGQSESTFLSVKEAMSARNCDIIAPNTTQNIEIDFWRKFAFASSARTAYVGHQSSLLLASIEYLRQQEIWRQGRNPPLIPELLTCFTGIE